MSITRKFCSVILLTNAFLYLPLRGKETSSSGVDFSRRVRQGIEQILQKHEGQTHIGIDLYSLKTKKHLFKKNSEHLFLTADQQKVVTSAAALYILGPEYRFSTTLFTDGEFVEGTLRGNLYLQGSGDPSFTYEDLFGLFGSLREKGVEKITGNLMLDLTCFDQQERNPSWMIDDIDNPSCSPVSALNIDKNTLMVRVCEDEQNRGKLVVSITPSLPFFKIGEFVKDQQNSLSVSIKEKSKHVLLSGTIEKQQLPCKKKFPLSPHDLAIAYCNSICKELGIVFSGSIHKEKVPKDASTIASHTSDPLSTLIYKSLKANENLTQDVLLKKLGEGKKSAQGSWETGRKTIENFLVRDAGLDQRDFFLVDGSGISRCNSFSPKAMISFFEWIMTSYPYRAELLSALSLAGIDGIISERMKNRQTLFRGLAGDMNRSSSLVGIAQTKDNELILFSVFFENFSSSSHLLCHEIEDEIVLFLSELSRKN